MSKFDELYHTVISEFGIDDRLSTDLKKKKSNLSKAKIQNAKAIDTDDADDDEIAAGAEKAAEVDVTDATVKKVTSDLSNIKKKAKALKRDM